MSHPILVTGSHRSGTTWVGKMLCLSREAGYIHEPFNPRRRPGWSGDRIPHWFLYVCPDNEQFYEGVARDVLRFRYPVARNVSAVRGARQAALFAQDVARSVRYRLDARRPLLKDPIALFSSEWLAARFGTQPVVMIRNPLGFVSSIKKLNWQFRFRSWLAQDLLVRDLLAPFHDDMHRCWAGDCDIVDQGIVMWNALHYVIGLFQDRHPDWIFMRHEDLAARPEQEFTALYQQLGLTWSTSVAGRLARYSTGRRGSDVPVWRHTSIRRDSRAATTTWKQRLSPAEIERISSGTAEIGRRFYPESQFPA